MSNNEAARGRGVVMQPGEGKSYWQPKPANGYTEPKMMPSNTGFGEFSMGYQTIAPSSRVREHSHADQIELLVCFKGHGRVMIDGEPHPLVPGTTCFAGYDVKHEIINESEEEDLVMMWVIAPGGLEDFSATIGRPRQEGEPAPEPFERPADVLAVERELGSDNPAAE